MTQVEVAKNPVGVETTFYFSSNGKQQWTDEAGALKLIHDMSANGAQISDAINAVFVLQMCKAFEMPSKVYGEAPVKANGLTDALVGVRVSSSNIVAVGYDAANLRLYVFFENNAWYRYLDVPPEVFTKMITAESVGRALQSLVKDAGFAFDQMPL